MSDEPGTITLLLQEVESGRPGALDRLMETVHADLERLADRRLRARYGDDLAGVTLEPGALVNEVFLRLVRQRNRFDNRGQFFAIATRLMLRVLLDDHRRRAAARRAGGLRVSLDGEAEAAPGGSGVEFPDFLMALEKLERLDARTADVTKLRLIWGLSVAEIAQLLGVSEATVEREWRFARAWLWAEIGPSRDV